MEIENNNESVNLAETVAHGLDYHVHFDQHFIIDLIFIIRLFTREKYFFLFLYRGILYNHRSNT